MINIPTELLRTLVAVVDLRSFTKAAQSLGVTQPAVSAQIKRLQMLLDCELFDKSAPGVTLTSSGEVVVNQARRLLTINDRIVGLSAPTHMNSLRVGVTGDFSAPMLPPLMAELRARYPDIGFVVRCDQLDVMMRALQQGELDLFVGVSDSRLELDGRHEWTEPMTWVRSPKLRLAPDEPLPLVTFGEACAYHRAAVNALDAARQPYQVVFKGPSEATVMAAVRGGLGVGFTPYSRSGTTGCEVWENPPLPPIGDLFCGIYLGRHSEQPALEQLADGLFAAFRSKFRRSHAQSYAFSTEGGSRWREDASARTLERRR